jgi:putative nucleotidyltransferase with HDIG domain
MRRRLPAVSVLVLSAASAALILAAGGAGPEAWFLLLAATVLRAFPCWNDPGLRFALDAVPRLAILAITGPVEGLVAGALAASSGEALSDLVGSSGRRRRASELLTPLPGMVPALVAAISLGVVDMAGLLVYVLMLSGDALAHAWTVPTGIRSFMKLDWAIAALLTLPVAALVPAALSAGGWQGAVMMSVPLGAFTGVAQIRHRAMREYSRKTADAAVQNALSVELASSRSTNEFMNLLAGYLQSESEDDLVLLTSQGGGTGWLGWSTASQSMLPPLDGSAPPPAWNEIRADARVRDTEGLLLGLSMSGDMLLFAAGRPGLIIGGMHPDTRGSLVSLIRHSWQAVGHSMTIDDAFIAAAMMLARLADSKDDYTHGHSLRVARLSSRLGRKLGLSEGRVRTLRVGALLHDLGKVAIPSEILTKRGLLTRDERQVIQRHPSEGARILGSLKGYDEVRDIVSCHHERLDGNGYPSGLSGRRIPFLARIVAVADTFDAITSRRSYRADSDQNTAIEAIRSASGTQFDAKVVLALEDMMGSRDA